MSAATTTEAPLLVFFSSVSGNTARFIEKLGMPALRIPLTPADPVIEVDEPFVLVTPTYGGGQGRGEEKGAVPKQVIRFLNDEKHRRLIRGRRCEPHEPQRVLHGGLDAVCHCAHAVL